MFSEKKNTINYGGWIEVIDVPLPSFDNNYSQRCFKNNLF